MFSSLKTIGTVLTVASTAKFGKDMYDSYKSKKKARQIDEVHKFIGALDLNTLQRAIDTNDTDILIDAVEDIISVAETIRIKSDLEDFTDNVQEVAGNLFDKFTTVANKVADRVGEKIDEVKNSIEDEDEDEYEDLTHLKPTFKEFKKEGKPLQVKSENGKLYTITNDMDMVSTNNKNKTVTFIVGAKEVILTKLD